MRLQIENVSKIYPRGVVGVKEINLELGAGMFGLLGPNGAGKTTLMRMIATLLVPTTGDIRVNGHSVRSDQDAIRNMLGYLPQDFGVYPNLSAWEFLDYLAILDGVHDSRERKNVVGQALETVGLSVVAQRKLGGFSGGMRQRVGIAQILLKPRQLVIVDEPTAGLDPEERIRFRNLLSELGGDKTVILSTHIVPDVETTCNDLAIIKAGKILARSSPTSLIKSIEGKVWEARIEANELEMLKKKHRVLSIVHAAEGVRVRFLSEEKLADKWSCASPTLEDAYIYHVGEANNYA